MRAVSVIGTGMMRFGKYRDRTMADLAWPVVKAAIEEAGVDRSDIQAAYCGTAMAGMMAGQRVLKSLGLLGIPVINTENACSSSAVALREAWVAVGAGLYDVAVVFGVDTFSRFGGGALPREGEDWDGAYGLAMPGLYAMRARRYMHDYGMTAEELAGVAVKAHRHGALNPDAQYQNLITVEEVMAARPVADPFTLLHCCPTGDGVAAVVVCAAERAAAYCDAPVQILGSAQQSGVYKTGFRDFTQPESTIRTARLIYETTGLGPEDVDVAEVHDAFTIAELLYYEALGFCAPGEAVRLLADGETSVGGRIPVNPSGGLLAKGHPVGPTGVAQVVEIVRQLQGRCGARQVEGAKVGLTHVTGGGVSGLDHGTCTIHMFGR